MHRLSVYCAVLVASRVANADPSLICVSQDQRRGGNAHPLHGHPGLEPFNDMQGTHSLHTHSLHSSRAVPPLGARSCGDGPGRTLTIGCFRPGQTAENSDPFRSLPLIRSLFLGTPRLLFG